MPAHSDSYHVKYVAIIYIQELIWARTRLCSVTRSELSLVLAQMSSCTEFDETKFNISSNIERTQFNTNYLCGLENWLEVTWFKYHLALARIPVLNLVRLS